MATDQSHSHQALKVEIAPQQAMTQPSIDQPRPSLKLQTAPQQLVNQTITDKLRPILISPLKVKIDGRDFTCQGNDLRFNGTEFQANFAMYLLKRGKAGKASSHMAWLDTRPKDWWQAQCAFRGLPISGTLPQLQKRVQEAPNAKSPEVAAAEERLNREFRENNHAAKEIEWMAPDLTPERRAYLFPIRYLREQFALGERGSNAEPGAVADAEDERNNKVVVLCIRDAYDLRAAAKALNLQTAFTEAPPDSTGTRPADASCTVIGLTRPAVTRKVAEIKAEVAAHRAKVAAEKAVDTDRKHSMMIAEADERGADWDVFGTWAIKCPYAEENWGEEGRDCSLVLYEAMGPGGVRQIWADFDLIAITGVMRFIGPAFGKRAGSGQTDDLKRKRDEKEDGAGKREEDGEKRVKLANDGSTGNGNGTTPIHTANPQAEAEDEDDEEEDDSYDPRTFRLPPSTPSPSPSNPTWLYRWRGEETGEGEIQLDSDFEVYRITFSGPHGMRLRGSFGGGCFEDCDFEGWKVGAAREPTADVKRAWGGRFWEVYNALEFRG